MSDKWGSTVHTTNYTYLGIKLDESGEYPFFVAREKFREKCATFRLYPTSKQEVLQLHSLFVSISRSNELAEKILNSVYFKE